MLLTVIALDKHRVVYNIPFEPPCQQIYTGQTRRALKTRLYEHARDVANHAPSSSMASFCESTGAIPAFDRVSIRGQGDSKWSRLRKESLIRAFHNQFAVSKINLVLMKPPI